MKELLSPTLIEQVSEHVLLWFKNSNKYIVIDTGIYALVKAFLNAENTDAFKSHLSEFGFETNLADNYLQDIDQLLEDCHVKPHMQTLAITPFNSSNRKLSLTYKIDLDAIRIHYSTEQIKQLIHPPLEHLQSKSDPSGYLCEFDIYEEANRICLFKDMKLIGSWPKTDRHLLQGKFAMQVLCALHNNEETDWMGTFHSSAVSQNGKSVMIIGDSGKGKSTFTSLLLGQGFEVLSDDLTPILSKDSNIYPYPGGISVKSGAFDLLRSNLTHFENLAQHYINPYKGYVKYVPAPKSQGYLKGYPCKIVLSINYQPESKTQLASLSFQDALAILIPASWIEPSTINAQKFINWIQNVKFYQLTYSNSVEAINEFLQLIRE